MTVLQHRKAAVSSPVVEKVHDTNSKSPRKLWRMQQKISKRGGVAMSLLVLCFIVFYTTIEYQQMQVVVGEMVSQSGELVPVERTLVEQVYEDENVFDDPDCELIGGSQGQGRRKAQKRETKEGTQKGDALALGRCRYFYPNRAPPKNNHPNPYLGGIDFFFFREEHTKREACFLQCIDKLEQNEFTSNLLVEAATMGLTQVAKKLFEKYHLDPLKPANFKDRPQLSAIQEAIRGGYAEMVQILSKNNVDLVIDSLGRTVKDWISMKGSPIRPRDAKKYFGLDIATPPPPTSSTEEKLRDSGWYQKPDFVPDERCDIDVIHGELSPEKFYNDYWLPGRAFVIKNHVSDEELKAFDKSRWETTEQFHPSVKVNVGPTAYPNLTGQKRCRRDMSIREIEQLKECKEQPGVPMVHARHPNKLDWKAIYPQYKGNIYHEQSSWHLITTYFNAAPWDFNLSWQAFFGGDDSGATLHWHNAAFNALFTGLKEWAITPPYYRGMTGMPARDASKLLKDEYTIRCTQRPGDMMYIPDFWGHMTLNRGFAIGAAVILPHGLQRYTSPNPTVQLKPPEEEEEYYGEDGYYYGYSEDEEEDAVPKKKQADAVAKSRKFSQQKETLRKDAGKKLFFVHINKAGGTSMISMLSDRCRRQYVNGRWKRVHRSFHATATAFIEYKTREVWDNSESFAIVRHPLARQVSNFFFLMERCTNNRRGCAERMIPTNVDLAKLDDEKKVELFHEYTHKLYEKYPPGNKENYLFGSKGHGNEVYASFNATQTSWLVDDKDKIVVKHIFHLEDLSKDFAKLTEVIPCLKQGEAEAEKERRAKEEMVHENPSPKYPAYELFTKNKKTNQIIKEVFDVDFKNFGYKL